MNRGATIFTRGFDYFRKKGKYYFDRIHSERVRRNLLSTIPFWLGSLITGVVAVLYARLFALAESLSVIITQNYGWVLFILMPLCFITAWWMVKKLAPFAQGSGIPQVMAAIELANPKDYHKVKRFLSVKIILYKMLSSFVLVLGGGAVGREGPTIQIGASVFNKVYEWLPGWWPRISKKSMLVTGAAAGLSAAFNTPLGGVVFAVEELTKIHFSHFKTAIFTAVIIAGLTAQQLAGSYLYLGYPQISSVSTAVFFTVIVLAIAAGLSSAYLCKCIIGLRYWRRRFTRQWQHVVFLTLSALIMASIAYFFNRAILGSGKSLMEGYLFSDQKYAAWYIPLLRMIGPALSFASGGAGGIFAPALSAGASMGSLFSGWLHFSASDTNIMMLAGMVAFLTGVTRAPFTSAILVLEMTDRHSLILHLMMAGILANFAGKAVSRHSFYDQIKQDYLHQVKNDERVAKSQQVT